MNLTEFLLARIAEDESVARRPTPDEYEYGESYMFWQEDATDEVQWHTALCGLRMGEYMEACQCDVRARVLAECEAKRHIVNMWADPFGGWNAPQAEAARAQKDSTLRLLALPYADHPEYDEAWRP